MPIQKRYPSYLADQRHFFDELITEDWDTYLNSHSLYVWEYEIRELFRRIGTPRRILNIGSGCGFHDSCMARYSEVQEVIS
ncbi:MAG TPA: hypothetical protein VJ044_10475, partial [Candidatus Hodarchaeales archaeon]|nr:hypothetical protein [Candidatus Hodarchaeales archaeon]